MPVLTCSILVLEDAESVFKQETSSGAVSADRERQEREHEQVARMMEAQQAAAGR